MSLIERLKPESNLKATAKVFENLIRVTSSAFLFTSM